jgi:hypothetical protein
MNDYVNYKVQFFADSLAFFKMTVCDNTVSSDYDMLNHSLVTVTIMQQFRNLFTR